MFRAWTRVARGPRSYCVFQALSGLGLLVTQPLCWARAYRHSPKCIVCIVMEHGTDSAWPVSSGMAQDKFNDRYLGLSGVSDGDAYDVRHVLVGFATGISLDSDQQ